MRRVARHSEASRRLARGSRRPQLPRVDAIKLLKKQHRDVQELFGAFEKARGAKKKQIVEQICDLIALHAALEETHFYPAAKRRDTEDLLLEAVEEHLSVKRIMADLLELDAEDDTFEPKVRVLEEQFNMHVKEEEKELFPQVKKRLDDEELNRLGEDMEAMQEEILAEGAPRERVPNETQHAAEL